MDWIRETPPRWTSHKAELIGRGAAGIFDSRYTELQEDAPVSGEWWRVELGGKIMGYGWLDVVWGDAEILLVTAPDARGTGVGAFVLDKLTEEARSRGLRYIYNVVRSTHPDEAKVTAWLTKQGFSEKEDGRLLRMVPQA